MIPDCHLQNVAISDVWRTPWTPHIEITQVPPAWNIHLTHSTKSHQIWQAGQEPAFLQSQIILKKQADEKINTLSILQLLKTLLYIFL